MLRDSATADDVRRAQADDDDAVDHSERHFAGVRDRDRRDVDPVERLGRAAAAAGADPIRDPPEDADGGVRIGGTEQELAASSMPSAPIPPMRERGLAVEERQHVGVEVDAERECGQRPERVERARDLLALGHVAGDREAGFERAAQAEDGDLGHRPLGHPARERARLAAGPRPQSAPRARRERCAAAQLQAIGLGDERRRWRS